MKLWNQWVPGGNSSRQKDMKTRIKLIWGTSIKATHLEWGELIEYNVLVKR